MSDRTSVTQRYRGTSAVEQGVVRLVSDLQRQPVRVSGRLKDPLRFREAMSALHEIVRSDLRYKPKDRSAYLAYQRLKKRSLGLQQLQAQRAYYDWLARNDPLAWFVLDPVVTVHPDGVLFEVFSRDEGTYAQLRVDRSALEVEGAWIEGTTNIDFTDTLFDGLQRIRTTRDARLTISPEAVGVTVGDEEVVEKRVQVPDAWLRGFLQVQSSATLARAGVRLAPIELYNMLRHLRLHGDQKGKGRAVRIELVPGEAPRLVLEPWEALIETTSGPYAGRRPEVIRIWGRKRWRLVSRFLPFVDDIELHLIGSGLPSFLVLRAGPISLTLGLTGFTASNWSRSLQFDALLPHPGSVPAGESAELQQRVLETLGESWAADWRTLVTRTGATPAQVLAVLQAAGQNGWVMFDLATGQVRLRPLTAEPLDPQRLAFRNDVEKLAHDLVESGAVELLREGVAPRGGVELVAHVKVLADQREYRTSFVIDDDGRVQRAECTCHQFRSHGLKEGPCAHLMALRLRYAELLTERAAGRGHVPRTETKTFARRSDAGEAVTQVSLDETRLRVRWGQRTDARLRVQNLLFDSIEDARAAYEQRVAGLEAAGWLDASAR